MKRLVFLGVLLALVALGWLARPLSSNGFDSHPHYALSYAAAVRLVDSLRAADSPAIATECGTELLTHGEPTTHVVVLLHGLTNCPAQCDSLARLIFARGANVLVPRLPHHGFANRMTGELAGVNAHELCAFTDRVLDAAHGLGDSVTVAGLSISGVMAAWAGQERADVSRAVVIAPLFAWARAPGRGMTALIARVAETMPNGFFWWDSEARQDLAGPRHVYPRFSTRSVAASLRLGGAVRAEAARSTPASPSLVMITVGGDKAADNAASAGVVSRWRARDANEVLTYEFPASLHLNHDVVDPQQIGGNPRVTYPVLLHYIAPWGDRAARTASARPPTVVNRYLLSPDPRVKKK